MSFFDALSREHRDSKYNDDRLEAMIFVLVAKLMDKKYLTYEEASDVMRAENILKEMKKIQEALKKK